MGIGHADLDMDEWYFPYVFNSIGNELVGREHEGENPDGGMAAKLFYPNESMTRKEVAEMLYRMKAAKDNDSASYEEDTMEPNLIIEMGADITTEEMAAYSSDTLKLAFSYPTTWENLDMIDEPDHKALTIDGNIFLGADNGEESVGRGAYWGDDAELIVGADYISNYCDEVESDECAIYTNDNGVTYVKWTGEYGGFEITVQTNYYIYNSNSEYRGVILSAERLNDAGVENAEEDLEELVESLYFLAN